MCRRAALDPHHHIKAKQTTTITHIVVVVGCVSVWWCGSRGASPHPQTKAKQMRIELDHQHTYSGGCWLRFGVVEPKQIRMELVHVFILFCAGARRSTRTITPKQKNNHQHTCSGGCWFCFGVVVRVARRATRTPKPKQNNRQRTYTSQMWWWFAFCGWRGDASNILMWKQKQNRTLAIAKSGSGNHLTREQAALTVRQRVWCCLVAAKTTKRNQVKTR